MLVADCDLLFFTVRQFNCTILDELEWKSSDLESCRKGKTDIIHSVSYSNIMQINGTKSKVLWFSHQFVTGDHLSMWRCEACFCYWVSSCLYLFAIVSSFSSLTTVDDSQNFRLSRLDALGLLCESEDNYFKSQNKFINSSIYDIIKDMAPAFDDTMGFCSSPLELNMDQTCSDMFTRVWTAEGLCYAFNSLNSHEMFTDE